MSDTPQGPGWWMANDRKWYPPTEGPHTTVDPADVERFAPPTSTTPPPQDRPATPPSESDATPETSSVADEHNRKKPATSRRLLALVATLAVVLVALVAGVIWVLTSEDDTTDLEADPAAASSEDEAADSSEDQASTPPSEPDVDPRGLFLDVAGAEGSVIEASTVEVDDRMFGFAVIEEDSLIDVAAWTGSIRRWEWNGTAWVDDDPIVTELPVRSWLAADVTGDGADDLIVEIDSPDGSKGSVLTMHTGDWEFADFNGSAGTWFVDSPLTYTPVGLTSETNTCVPDCATGIAEEHLWVFDSQLGRFVDAAS